MLPCPVVIAPRTAVGVLPAVIILPFTFRSASSVRPVTLRLAIVAMPVTVRLTVLVVLVTVMLALVKLWMNKIGI